MVSATAQLCNTRALWLYGCVPFQAMERTNLTALSLSLFLFLLVRRFNSPDPPPPLSTTSAYRTHSPCNNSASVLACVRTWGLLVFVCAVFLVFCLCVRLVCLSRFVCTFFFNVLFVLFWSFVYSSVCLSVCLILFFSPRADW